MSRADLIASLTRVTDALDEAMTTHIYDEDNGDEIPADCGYKLAIEEARRVLANAMIEQPLHVIVEVNSGVAETTQCPDGVSVEIIDRDVEDQNEDGCTNPSGHEWNRSAGEADEARMAGDYENDNIRCIHCGADGDA